METHAPQNNKQLMCECGSFRIALLNSLQDGTKRALCLVCEREEPEIFFRETYPEYRGKPNGKQDLLDFLKEQEII